MKTNLLLPYGFKRIGWIMLVPTLLYGAMILISNIFGEWSAEEWSIEIFNALGLPTGANAHGDSFLTWRTSEQVMNNIVIIGIVLGALFVGCSREKVEDELIAHLRHDSLLIALWINNIILLSLSLFVYNMAFLNVMIYNMFTMILIFLVVFRYKLWRLRRETSNEE